MAFGKVHNWRKWLQLVPHVLLGKQQPNGPLDHPLGSHGVHPVMDVATNWLQEMAIQKGLVEQKGMVVEGEQKGMVVEGDATCFLPHFKLFLG